MMPRKIMAPLGALFILLLFGCGPPRPPAVPGYRTMPESFYRNGEATVTVREVGFGLGTGVVVDRRGYVLTNHHVVAEKSYEVVEAGSKKVFRGSGKYEVCTAKEDAEEACVPARIVRQDKALDLALLKADREFPYAVVFSTAIPEPFDFLYVWANLRDLTGVAPFRGRMVAKVADRYAQEPGSLIVIDVGMNPGGSGAPVFDRDGHCVGLITSVTPPPGRSMTIAVSAKVIVVFLKEAGIGRTAPSVPKAKKKK